MPLSRLGLVKEPNAELVEVGVSSVEKCGFRELMKDKIVDKYVCTNTKIALYTLESRWIFQPPILNSHLPAFPMTLPYHPGEILRILYAYELPSLEKNLLFFFQRRQYNYHDMLFSRQDQTPPLYTL